MKKSGLLLVLSLSAGLLTDAGRAEACGGCFTPGPDVSVVTDHRMALSVSPQQTILWDQIRYSGDPREFAWVLPVRSGAHIEVANDEFFSALDASTQPKVYPPQNYNALGCALTGCAADSESASSLDNGSGGGVTIVSQSVVGPYDQSTLRATDNDALVTWLRQNAYYIPSSIEPTIAAYVREGFDFIALKLRPECGQRSMRPVRVVTPGSAPVLPLRMVAAGVGPKVGITLYVITEGRYQPQNFPHALIPDERLRWDRNTVKSNYEDLSQDLMAASNGKTWLIEYADKPALPFDGPGWHTPVNSYARAGSTTAAQDKASAGLANTYYSLCKYYSGPSGVISYTPGSASSSSGGIGVTPCPDTADAGLPGHDGGANDAGDDDDDAGMTSDAGDAGGDAGDAGDAGDDQQSSSSSSSGFSSSSSSSGSPFPPSVNVAKECAYLDDLDSALDGLHKDDVWVTRMRSILPVGALSDDLILEPVKTADGRAETATVSNLHWTPYYADDDVSSNDDVKSDCSGTRHPRRPYASWTAMMITAVALGATWIRRRRRPK